MAKYVVCPASEIPAGARKIVEIDGRKIGVFNLNGEYFALLDRCPHQAGPLCNGRTYGFVDADVPGEYNYSRPGELLRCPWHGWEYDIRTGQSWFDPRGVRVRAYDVEVESGAALADKIGGVLPSEAQGEPDPAMCGLAKGPYVAVTFPVTVEQEYVVVEV
jgi:3-phenylpropionate/trans-cinnamate dioxygenase ferredoxin subunit